MKLVSIPCPLDECMANAMKSGVPAGTNALDWFLNTQVPMNLRLVSSCVLLQPSRVSAILNPNRPEVTPVFYFFFEEQVTQ